MSKMLALSVIKQELREGKYAWPGGYPKFFLCADGEYLSYDAAYECRRQIFRSHIANELTGYYDPQWILVGYDVNWEDAHMVCSHTGKLIECAYRE